MATAQLHTIADLMALPDIDRYELIEGELFAVSPSGFDPECYRRPIRVLSRSITLKNMNWVM